MALQFTIVLLMAALDPLVNTVPTEFEISSEGSRHSILIPLAASEDGLKWVAVEVRLWGGSWQGVDMHECKFAIIHFDDDIGRPTEIFDRYMASGFLGAVQHLVMPCVCAAIGALIEKVRPNVIYRATYATRPPSKALGKHQMITDKIVTAGYEVVQEGFDTHFRKYWLMMKPSGDADG